MRIIIVRSPDGDLYYQGNRSREIGRAVDRAAEITIANPDWYDTDDITEIKAALDMHDWRKLESLLIQCGAIRIGSFQ